MKYLLFLTFITTLALHADPMPGKATNPNIIVILTDDQGWGDLSVHGNSNLKTPHIDALAASGTSFSNFFVQPVCSPTRAEMLTGRYARRLGVYSTSSGGERLNLGETTIADVFRKSGYATAAYGKWHNGSQPPYHPNSRGFDDFYGFTSGHWGSYFSPMLEHNGEPVKGTGFLPDDLTNRSMAFIREHATKPFFLLLSLNTPHSPMQVPDAYWDRFKDKPLALFNRDPEAEDTVFTRAALALVENIDYNVGRLTQLLDSLGLQENTIVVYLSDNGPNSYRWNAGMRGRKGSTDEGGVRVPFFISWEGHIPKGRKVDEIAGAIDLMPTLTALAGIPYKTQSPLDGSDLGTLLTGDRANWEERLLFQYWDGATSVRSAQYRLDNENRLYDMTNDPGQYQDISRDNNEITLALTNAKSAWLKDTGSTGLAGGNRAFTLGYENEEYTHLPARDAAASGMISRSNRFPNCSFFTNWNTPEDFISWDIEVLKPGRYEVVLYYTCAPGDTGAVLQLEWMGQAITQEVRLAHNPPLYGMKMDRSPRMESYVKDFRPMKMGVLQLGKGRGPLKLSAQNMPGNHLVDVRMLLFRKIG